MFAVSFCSSLYLIFLLSSVATAAQLFTESGSGDRATQGTVDLKITSSSQIVDLSECSQVTAGIGFSFRNSNATATAKNYISIALPKCKIGTLDALYFYVYGCSFPATFVPDLSNGVGADFLYSSDKSLTLVSTTATSLLLANAWQLQLIYNENDSNYSVDMDNLSKSSGCVVSEKKTSTNWSLVVSCGSMTCSGCNAIDFFTAYHFNSAKFIID